MDLRISLESYRTEIKLATVDNNKILIKINSKYDYTYHTYKIKCITQNEINTFENYTQILLLKVVCITLRFIL